MHSLSWIIYRQPLNRIILWMLLLNALWAAMKAFVGTRKTWKLFNAVVICASLFGIIGLTVLNRTGGTHDVILRPFTTFEEAQIQPELYRAMLMNVFLFVPLGLSMPNVIEIATKYSKRWKPVTSVLLAITFGFLLSTTIEYLQYRYSLGHCEVDDVIMNTLGTAIGASSYVIKFPGSVIADNYRRRTEK